MTSLHYMRDRQDRENLINEIGKGEVVATFVVDKGHPKGPELHEVTSTGIIVVYNYRTKKLVTKMIARPAQLARYFGKGNVPKNIWKIAQEHQRKGYNEM